MRIAILGAGFAGLATTWFLLNYTKGTATIDLYDPRPIGSGASGLSSGLLHPYAGKRANRSWGAGRSTKETHRLLTVASQAIDSPLVLSHSLLRPAMSEAQVKDFQNCAETYPDVEWWSKEQAEKTIPHMTLPDHGGGLYIPEGLTIDTSAYLEGLWQACARLGTQHYPSALINQEDLAHYDQVLIAVGAQSMEIPILKPLKLTPLKGQILELTWPKEIPPLPFSLVGPSYIVMGKENQTCHVGSTFEREFTSPDPDPEFAYEQIMKKVIPFFPDLKNAELLNCRAGIRMTAPKRLPVVGRIAEKYWFFTGLGSKGLLYHAYVGKMMARALLTKDERHLPQELVMKIDTPNSN